MPPVHREPLPVDAERVVVDLEQQLPDLLEVPGFGPRSEAAVAGGRRGAEALARQRAPLAARAKHIDDGVKDLAVGHGGTAARAGLFLGPEDGRDSTPQIVRHMPDCFQRGLGGHDSPLFLDMC
jgi:hypothetical protein